MITMDLKEFNEKYLKLEEDTMRAIGELEELTNKPVLFRIINTSEAHGHYKLKIKLAREFMNNHIVIINTDNVDCKEDLNYLIIHEMVHGFRTFKAPENERKTLMSNSENIRILVENIAPQAENLPQVMPKEQIPNFLESLIWNTNTLLLNASVDARIEMYIYENYPSIRKLQKKVQKNYVKELVYGFNPNKTKGFIPNWISERVNLMNYCYLRKLTPIIGKSWTSRVNCYIDDEFITKSNELMKYLETEDKGQLTDNETILEWGKLLEMNNLTRYTHFENVEFTYCWTN